MTQDEKDRMVADLLKMLQELPIHDMALASVTYFRKLSNFVDAVHKKGKIEGFDEGYKEARKKLEKQLGKLN